MITFKFQDAFYILLPDRYDWENNYRTWEIVFGLVICLKMIAIWLKIYYQCDIDIFFLDRERKKERFSESSPNAWRLIFVANEYNELQMMQYVSMELTLVWYVFFMEGVGWRLWSAHDPDLSDDINDSVLNKYINFSIIIIVLVSIGLVQYLLKRGLGFLFPLPIHNFVDLCSITNVSVFIFDQRLHGYYIHGESTGGQSDVSFNELRDYLQREENGESRPRGMLSEYPELQTFEIFLPVKIRQLYEVVYKRDVINEINKQREHLRGYENTSRFFNLSPLPKGMDILALINQRDEMSQFFMNYISQAKNYPQVAIREKSLCQIATGLPPADMNKKDTPIFIKDNWFSYRKI